MANDERIRVLVAVDGSDPALEAVRYVGLNVPGDRLEVVVFHVMTKIPESFWDLEKEPAFHYKIANIGEWESQQERLIEAFMAKARSALADLGVPEGAVTTRIEARKEGIARDILAESRGGYAAVVVGRMGLSQLKDLVMGSVAGKLIGKLVHIPIWVVSGSRHAPRMLLSVDTSEEALRTVDHVGAMVGAGGPFEITLFHAIRGLNVFLQGFGDSYMLSHDQDWIQRVDRELEHAEEEVLEVFEKAKQRLVGAGVPPERVRQKIVKGVASRAGAIVDEAESGGHDTIVVGRRGLSRIQEFFMGRVSSKVLQLARAQTVWVVS
ncbi:MAG: universal stress protein [Syntrophobacteraceae bacterium]|jgi:nucleotide-binding universal stress UspA family protein|nr:universal stress protein [Syntrophobacteraceae bacterium]